MEYIDKCRYKIGLWKSCGKIENYGEKEVINVIENCLVEY